jgi:hypothetical protein
MCDFHDPSARPPASGFDPRKIDKPNPVPLAAGAWQSVSIKYPSLVVLTGVDPGGNLIAVPEMEKGSLTEVYTSIGAAEHRILYLHAPGTWRIRNTGGVNVTALVLDANDCCAALFYGGGLGGGSSAASASPLTMAAPATGSVGVASASLVAANPARRFISIENAHATGIVYLGFGNAAVVGSGIRIAPGNFKSFNQPGNDLSRAEIFAISTVAATTVAIQEGT